MNKVNKGTGAGGANTTKYGLDFEHRMFIKNILDNSKFILKLIESKNNKTELYEIIKSGRTIGYYGRQGRIYDALKICFPNKITSTYINDILSKKIHPDEFILNKEENKLIIFEVKWQQSEGSVDEKIQTAPYKLFLFKKLLKQFGVKIEYHYILSSWFNNKKYKNVFQYYNEIKENVTLWIENKDLGKLKIDDFIKI